MDRHIYVPLKTCFNTSAESKVVTHDAPLLENPYETTVPAKTYIANTIEKKVSTYDASLVQNPYQNVTYKNISHQHVPVGTNINTTFDKTLTTYDISLVIIRMLVTIPTYLSILFKFAQLIC